MTTTITRRQQPVQYAPVPSVSPTKEGVVAHRLAQVGFSDTAAGARQKALRAMNDLLLVAGTAIASGEECWLDQFFERLDTMRTAGAHLELDLNRKLGIEDADACDNCARTKYYLESTPVNAKVAINATQRAIRAGHEFLRGVRSAHPELAR